MGTVSKALKLLDKFSADRLSIGLSEFVKLSGHDKATVYRLLSELSECGLLEQDPDTRHYCPGPALHRLGLLRDKSFPQAELIRSVTNTLATRTGETAHASLTQGSALVTVAVAESTRHRTRVCLDDAELLPLHATASGHVVMAFSNRSPFPTDSYTDQQKLEPITSDTVTDDQSLQALLETTRQTGFGYAVNSFEAGVTGLAVPLFDSHGQCNGALAVASPSLRLTSELEALIKQELVAGAQTLTDNWSATVPATVERLWQQHA